MKIALIKTRIVITNYNYPSFAKAQLVSPAPWMPKICRKYFSKLVNKNIEKTEEFQLKYFS